MPGFDLRLTVLRNAHGVFAGAIKSHCRECESRELALVYLDLVFSNAVKALTAAPMRRSAAAGSKMRAAT